MVACQADVSPGLLQPREGVKAEIDALGVCVVCVQIRDLNSGTFGFVGELSSSAVAF